MNLNRLKGKIKEREMSQKACAEAIGISENAMYQKINGIDGRCFNVIEAEKLCKVLHINATEAVEIFLR